MNTDDWLANLKTPAGGPMTEKLKDGSFYWVRPAPGVDWEPAHFLDGAFYFLGHRQDGAAAEVGPELVPPVPRPGSAS